MTGAVQRGNAEAVTLQVDKEEVSVRRRDSDDIQYSGQGSMNTVGAFVGLKRPVMRTSEMGAGQDPAGGAAAMTIYLGSLPAW